MYSLFRKRDNAGNEGDNSIVFWKENESIEILENSKPIIGKQIYVADSLSSILTSFWVTTVVTEILEESENYCLFKTTNSIYEWKRY